MHIGNVRQPSPLAPSANLVMEVHPPSESSSHRWQNVAMYAQPSPPLRPPPHVMDVRWPGVYPYPPRGY